jgi:hypothetical protein
MTPSDGGVVHEILPGLHHGAGGEQCGSGKQKREETFHEAWVKVLGEKLSGKSVAVAETEHITVALEIGHVIQVAEVEVAILGKHAVLILP